MKRPYFVCVGIVLSLCCFECKLALSANSAKGQPIVNSLSKKYPNWILTNDYGILSLEDLKRDIERFRERSYDPYYRGGGAYWQCFETKWVSTRYDRSRDADPMGAADKIVDLCDFEIHVREDNHWDDYWDRRGRPLEFCTDFTDNWKHLTQGEPFVCLNGQPSGNETQTIRGKKRLIHQWVWNRFKTRKGCYSLFEGECPGEKPGPAPDSFEEEIMACRVK